MPQTHEERKAQHRAEARRRGEYAPEGGVRVYTNTLPPVKVTPRRPGDFDGDAYVHGRRLAERR